MAPLDLRDRPRVIEDEPPAEQLHGFVRSMTVKRHHRAGTAGGPGNLGSVLFADRRHFDAVLTAVDGFFEALDGHGGVSILAP